MRKKLILGTILTLSLVLIVAVVAVIPTIANTTPSNSITKYATDAEVILQLPTPSGAIASRPTNLRIGILDYDRRSNSADALQVYIWVSAMNTYLPIAFIGDQPWSAQEKTILNNTAMYLEVNGVVIRNNLKVVEDKELEVWTEKSPTGNGHWGWDVYGRYVWNDNSNILTANLTVPVQLDFTGLPPIFGQSFTVPAMYLKFVGIAEGLPQDQLTSQLPSGVTVNMKATAVPAWALVRIPGWGTGDQTFAGSIYQNFVITFTLPP